MTTDRSVPSTSDTTDRGASSLPLAGAALLLAEVWHVANAAALGSPRSHAPAITASAHLLAIVITLVALVAVRRGARWGGAAVRISGGFAVVAMLVYHLPPSSVPGINSYWRGGDVLDWLTVLAVAATGAWCVAAGRN